MKKLIAILLFAAAVSGCKSPYDYMENWLIREDAVRPFSVPVDIIYVQDRLYFESGTLPLMQSIAMDAVGRGKFDGFARVFSPLVACEEDVEKAIEWYVKHHNKSGRSFALIGEGEGGALLIKDPAQIENAEIIREKGTNRSVFLRGQIDKYTWVDHGSSYLPSDMNAAYLWAQLLEADKINNDRLAAWQTYYDAFEQLEQEGFVERPVIPEGCVHNAHMFYLKAKDLEERTALIDYFKKNDILAVFHYIPLHSAPAGVKFGRFHGEDVFTTKESDRLLRLPMYYGLKKDELNKIIDTVIKFYKG